MTANQSAFQIGGVFHVQCVGPDGLAKWEDDAPNGVTNEGLNKVLDVMFHATTPIGTWYIGLIDNAGGTSLVAGDTLAAHGGWTEYTNYTGNRHEWTEGAASSQSTTNSSTVDFVAATAPGTVYGVFLCSAASGTSGTLWATAALSGGTQALSVGDTLQVTYTVSAS